MLIKVSFFSNYYRDWELMSVTKARISNICYFTYMLTFEHIRTLSRALILWVTAGATFSSLSSISPRNNSIDPSTSSYLSSKMELLISLRIWLQSHPTFTSPFMISTMFFEHSVSKPLLNMLTKSEKIGLPRMNLRFIGFMVKFLKISVTVLMSSNYCYFLGGYRLWT